MTSDLTGRVWEHKNKVYPNSHTAKYNIKRLVYFEQYDDAETAIDREKLIKSKSRAYRVKLIEKDNPTWSELYHRLD
jgi:putative endonuclease